jgi:hypothetical protein
MMKPLDDENTYITSATSPSKETARPHRSRPILHLFLEREDASNDINKDTDKPSYLVTSESNRDELSSKDENRHDSKKDEQGESIIQKFRPMLQLFFDREKEKKLNVAPSNDSRKGTAPNGRSSESASIKNDKQSTRSSDDDDSVWKSYRRNTLSRNDSGDHSKIAPSSTTLRRRSSVGIASSTISDENISLETFSLGSLKDKSEKSNTGHRAITTAERKSPWYKNKMFLIFGCLLVIVLFCLFSAIPLVRKKNATSTSTSLSYNQQNHEGTKDATGSTSSQQTLPSKQPSPTTNQVPTNMPQTNVGGTKPTTGNVAVPSNIIKTPTKSPVSVPIKSPVVAPMKAPVSAPTKVPMVAPTKAPVSVPTKSPVTVPTNVVKPSSIQASTTDCFLTVSIVSWFQTYIYDSIEERRLTIPPLL